MKPHFDFSRMTRRGALVGLPFLVASCDAVAVEESPPLQRDEDTATLPSDSQGPTPQFLLGQDSAPTFLEVGFSLHCGESRRWFRNNFPAVARQASRGQRQVMFSHICRTESELAAGEAVMAVGRASYPDAMMAVLAFSIAENRPLSATEIRSFLPAAGYSTANASQTDKTALVATRVVYEAAGATSTPWMKETRKT